jgi:Na+-transporting NADH:ubiquinone oxidoreductase subunit NqrB
MPELLKHYQKINPQILQNFAIGSLLLIGGKFWGYVSISWTAIGLIFLTVTTLDYFLRKTYFKKGGFPHAALNSGIGISLFLRTENLIVYFFTAVLAIISKYIIRIDDRHFFNPSYTAIFASLALFPQIAYTNPLQWGSSPWVLLSMCTLGAIVLWRVRLLDAVLVFAASFLLIFSFLTEHSMEDYATLIFTGSFFIVMFFGFTDPKTIPETKIARYLFMIQIVVLFFIYRNYINENYSFFAAYATVNALELVFYWVKKHKSPTTAMHLRGILTGIFFVILLSISFEFKSLYGVFPEMLTNRCNQLICRPS